MGPLSIWYALVCVEPVGDGHPLPPEASGAYTHVAAHSASRDDFEHLVRVAAGERGLRVVEFDWACPEERLTAEGRTTSHDDQWALVLRDAPVAWEATLHWWTD